LRASACAVGQHPAVTGIRAEPVRPEGVPRARVGKASASFGRLVISWGSPGLPRPTRSPGRSSAGTAAVPPSPGSSSRGRTGARRSPGLLVCRGRSPLPSPRWDAMARSSGRAGLPICICGRIPLRRESEHPPTERERAGAEGRPAKEGGSRCHRSGRRRMRRQARRARRGSRSRRKRPRAGSSHGWVRPSAPRCPSLHGSSGFLRESLPVHSRSRDRPKCASSLAGFGGLACRSVLMRLGVGTPDLVVPAGARGRSDDDV
jgi:hypothetical protein